MRYFLCLLELETNINVVRYHYPEWLTEDLKKKLINLTNTTPADQFVDVVIGAETDEEANLLLENGCEEMTTEEFFAWKTSKLLVIKTLQKKQETKDEPTN